MKPALLLNIDEMQVALYKLARTYHGFFTGIHELTGYASAAMDKALNPYYVERPSFVTRSAVFFVAWLHLHPRSGYRALCAFIGFILRNAPNDEIRSQLRTLHAHIEGIAAQVETMQRAIESIPMIRLECRELVRRHKPRTTDERKRRSVKKLVQPAIL